ncbi:MAG: plastocyanin/azurin family copper-binding protein [Acidimicrobiales bacterium]|jgi:plastocyanin|nr:plastocyanin/azurin family copper-binding protein [Acidimicrobiales bacterium]
MGSQDRAARRRRARHGSSAFDGVFAMGTGAFVIGVALILGLLILLVSRWSGDDGGSGPKTEGAIVATEFRFTPARVESGTEVELVLRNEGAIYHDLVIEGVDYMHLKVLPGEEDQAGLLLEPGRYVFYCTIPDHRDAGMFGELVVG